MRLTLLLPFLLLAALTGTAQKAAQPDYLVNMAGDTLRGQLRQVGKHYGTVRLYRPGQATTEYSAAEARSYGSTYGPEGISRVAGPHGKPQFLVPLVQGYVSLFAGENEQQEPRFYLQVPDSAYVIEVALITNQLTLARHLPGCSTLVFGSNDLQHRFPYTSEGLSNLVLAYNRCRQPGQPSQLVRRDRGLRYVFGLKAGGNVSYFNLSAAPYPSLHTNALGYQGGVTLNVASRTHFSVQLEAVYLALRSTYGPFDLANYTSGIPASNYAANIRYALLQVPVLLRYAIGHGALQPYLNAGPSVALILGNTSVIRYPTANSAVDLPIELSSIALGFAAGGGVMLHRASLPAISLEARFDNMIDSNKFIFYTPKHTSFRLDVGVSF